MGWYIQEIAQASITKFLSFPFLPSPPGCLGTAGILTYGLICFINNKPKQSQMMMRARVIAQGLTVASLLVGMAVTNRKTSKWTSCYCTIIWKYCPLTGVRTSQPACQHTTFCRMIFQCYLGSDFSCTKETQFCLITLLIYSINSNLPLMYNIVYHSHVLSLFSDKASKITWCKWSRLDGGPLLSIRQLCG